MWLSVNSSEGAASDIECLKGVKAQLNDPHGYLASWDFSNMTEGFICQFNGIECWHPDESKVLNIRLSNMGLRGHFPSALRNCTSMVGLHLSANELSGPLPEDIGRIIPFVTSLDLSSNNFTGEIPASLANCSYLNILRLQHNYFSGQIPWQLGRLNRLSEFSVGDNAVSGKISSFTKPSSSGNNLGPLDFGKPSDPFKAPSKHLHTGIIIGAAVGGTMVGIMTMGAVLLFSSRKATTLEKEEEDPEENKWAKSIKGTTDIKFNHRARKYWNVHISTFEKTVPRMRLHALLRGTSNFSKDALIGCGKAGTMYKGRLPDGSSIAIKRLHDSELSHKEFMSEMMTLGCLRHRNLIPLLGFCIARNERLLIYKHMPKGTLYQQLHEVKSGQECMEWPLRLKVAIGVARGLAWLHHSCNPSIIHQRISSKQILLDVDFEPKISKFSYAGLMNPTESYLTVPVNNISSDLLGFVAPEFERKVVASPPGDVYSFGVVLLELITRQKPAQMTSAPKEFKGNLVEWVTHLKAISLVRNVIDRSLIGKGYDGELFQFLRVALACVESEPENRPTMTVIFRLLQSIGNRYGFTNDDETRQPQVCSNSSSDDGFNAEGNTRLVKALSAFF